MRKLKTSIWPFQLTIKPTDRDIDIDGWCVANVGSIFNDWYAYYTTEGKVYGFKDEGVFLLFKLRWSYNG